MANVMTRAITSVPTWELGALEGVLEVVEPDELVVGVERDAHGVEPQLHVVRPVGDLAQPRGGHPAHLVALVLVQFSRQSPLPSRRDLTSQKTIVWSAS